MHSQFVLELFRFSEVVAIFRFFAGVNRIDYRLVYLVFILKSVTMYFPISIRKRCQASLFVVSLLILGTMPAVNATTQALALGRRMYHQKVMVPLTTQRLTHPRCYTDITIRSFVCGYRPHSAKVVMPSSLTRQSMRRFSHKKWDWFDIFHEYPFPEIMVGCCLLSIASVFVLFGYNIKEVEREKEEERQRKIREKKEKEDLFGGWPFLRPISQRPRIIKPPK